MLREMLQLWQQLPAAQREPINIQQNANNGGVNVTVIGDHNKSNVSRPR